MKDLVATLPKIFAYIVALTGVMVIIGWIFDVAALKSILPQFVTMKLTTAICFVLSAITLHISSRIGDGTIERDRIALMFVNYIILLIMASLVTSVFIGIKTGFEDLFVRESAGAVMTTVPGRPAISTMVAFVAVALIGLARCSARRDTHVIAHVLGSLIAAAGLVAIVGYIVGVPALYYHLGSISSAMALHTAILFVLLGAGFVSIRGRGPRPA